MSSRRSALGKGLGALIPAAESAAAPPPAEPSAGPAEIAIEGLREHYDVGDDRGEIGQILHAYGFYRGLPATMAALGAEFIAPDGQRLSERPGFGVVTMDDGSFRARDAVALPCASPRTPARTGAASLLGLCAPPRTAWRAPARSTARSRHRG